MSTDRKARIRLALAAVAGLLWAGPLAAQTTLLPTTDQAAGYIVFPKVISDPAGLFNNGVAEDTMIEITNTNATTPRVLECFYVDGTNTCTNGPPSVIDAVGGACRTSADCFSGGACTLTSCTAINFFVQLTANQTIGWAASTGVQQTGICSGGTTPGLPCNSSLDCGGSATCPTLNIGAVPPLSPGVFFGELKCVQIDGSSTSTTTDTPINANDMIGNATIYEVSPEVPATSPSTVDVRAYNAIGLRTVSATGAPQTDTTLVLGGTSGTEYAGCPAQLIVNHFYDGSEVGTATVTTDLTFVPCSERPEGPIGDSDPTPTQLQFLTFNEFEQRFSATTTLRCFREVQMSNIDRRVGQESTSIFNIAVQGTLAGQTVVRPVLSSTTPQEGNGVLAIAEEYYSEGRSATGHSTAFNVNVRGTKTQGDFVVIP